MPEDLKKTQDAGKSLFWFLPANRRKGGRNNEVKTTTAKVQQEDDDITTLVDHLSSRSTTWDDDSTAYSTEGSEFFSFDDSMRNSELLGLDFVDE